MGQILHGSATTTEAVRRAIQHGQESLRGLAKRYGVNRKTIAKWKARSSVSAKAHKLFFLDRRGQFEGFEIWERTRSVFSILTVTRRSLRSISRRGPGWPMIFRRGYAQRHGSQNDRLDLLERALMRRLIWTPAHQLRSVAKSIPGDMVEPHLNDELRSQRLPFPASLGAPAARTARGFSGEAGSLA